MENFYKNILQNRANGVKINANGCIRLHEIARKGKVGRKMSEKNITIVSPANGTAVTLEQVPDAVFADKILGDGMAVIPSDGKFVSPIDGEVASVADKILTSFA